MIAMFVLTWKGCAITLAILVLWFLFRKDAR